MNSTLDNINLDINTMLINWGLINERYQDGVIRTTKFGIINMAFALGLFSFEAIKWPILMFYKLVFWNKLFFEIWLLVFCSILGIVIYALFIVAIEVRKFLTNYLIYFTLFRRNHFILC